MFTKEYLPPNTIAPVDMRASLRDGLTLLKEAGWVVKNEKLVNAKTGEPMQFEVLLNDAVFERITLPFTKNLERLGVNARVRTVDTAQYQKRMDDFDFDMTVVVWGESLSPGNEQRDHWTSKEASVPGSRNYAGIRDPVVDKLVDLVIQAPDRPSLMARTRALDRVLLWGFYVIPQWHYHELPRRLLGQVRQAARLAEVRARPRHLVGRSRRRRRRWLGARAKASK